MNPLSRSAWAEIDLEVLKHNISMLSRSVHPARYCAVVKADAYGHGSEEVSRVAADSGASCLAVATMEEGCRLREAGISLPILLLAEPERDDIEVALAKALTLSVYSMRTLIEVIAAWERLAKRLLEVQPPKIHIHIDTGMHRVGARLSEAVTLGRLALEGGVDVEGVFSHFAVADEGEAGRGATLAQMRSFETARARLATAGVSPKVVHLANSAGALVYPASRYDMVRFGIAMYGYAPSGHVYAPSLRPVLSLKTRVAFVQRVAEGEAVSYGLRRPLETASNIATLPIGYADGLPRLLFDNGAEFLVRGTRVPLAGVVTMDQIMIDCGQLDIHVGEEVVLIGRQGNEFVGANEWGERSMTSVYEILCRIGPRIPRIFRVPGLGEREQDFLQVRT